MPAVGVLVLPIVLAFLKRIKEKGEPDNRPRLRKCSLNVNEGVGEDMVAAVLTLDDEESSLVPDDEMEVEVDVDDDVDDLFFFCFNFVALFEDDFSFFVVC